MFAYTRHAAKVTANLVFWFLERNSFQSRLSPSGSLSSPQHGSDRFLESKGVQMPTRNKFTDFYQ